MALVVAGRLERRASREMARVTFASEGSSGSGRGDQKQEVGRGLG